MANNILTLEQVNDLMADFIQEKLGLNQDQVLIAYSEKGQRSYDYNKDLVFIHVEQESDEVETFKNRVNTQNSTTYLFTSQQTSMRALTLDVSVYGTHCDTLAIQLKELFYLESANEFLYLNNLSLISNRVNISNKVHELVNGRWWDRVDLSIGFYNSVSIDESNAPFEEMVWTVYKR